MRNFKIVAVVIAAMGISLTASAQLRLGAKAGLDINTVHSSRCDIENSNRVGFTAGVTAEYCLPTVKGLGVDLSVMFAHRNAAYGNAYQGEIPDEEGIFTICDIATDKQDFIEIPLNVKYKFGGIAAKCPVTPYLAVGPSIAFRCSEDKSVVGFKSRKSDFALNFGAGVEVINNLQIGVNYRLGLGDTVESQFKPAWSDVKAKNRAWQINATYYFNLK